MRCCLKEEGVRRRAAHAEICGVSSRGTALRHHGDACRLLPARRGPARPTHGLPELLAGAAVVGLHLWEKNTLLSIAVGTALYMVLVQAVFV